MELKGMIEPRKKTPSLTGVEIRKKRDRAKSSKPDRALVSTPTEVFIPRNFPSTSFDYSIKQGGIPKPPIVPKGLYKVRQDLKDIKRGPSLKTVSPHFTKSNQLAMARSDPYKRAKYTKDSKDLQERLDFLRKARLEKNWMAEVAADTETAKRTKKKQKRKVLPPSPPPPLKQTRRMKRLAAERNMMTN